MWRRQDEELEVKLREMEEREILYYARFREVFRNEPSLLAWLDGPPRWEERILQRRQEREARRRQRDGDLLRVSGVGTAVGGD